MGGVDGFMQWSFPDGPGWTGEAEHGGVRHGAWPSIWAACCLGVMVIGVRGQAPQALSECEALCAGLADAIRAAPEMLVMRIEDALVFNEQCAPEIVTTAIDVVGGQPELVKQIFETAVKVAPRQSDRIVQAARNFSVPAASVATAPPVEVRQAVVPTLIIDGMEVEVKRAEAPVMIGNIPLEEVRRAEMPLRALTVDEAAALPFPEVSLLPAADMTSWPSEEVCPACGPDAVGTGWRAAFAGCSEGAVADRAHAAAGGQAGVVTGRGSSPRRTSLEVSPSDGPFASGDWQGAGPAGR